MQLFKSEWLHEDRRDARPHAHRGPRYGVRYGRAHVTRDGQAGPRTARIMQGLFGSERELEILQQMARYDRAA